MQGKREPSVWDRIPYPLVCAAVGLAVGWTPALVHGPIPAKFDRFFLDGHTAVWAFYSARSLIGALVGLVAWPRRWLLRGPMCGLVAMVPPGFFLLATPGCGPT
ncbi:MAG: hypothetical protein D6815_06685 [Candidatus Dadabacteria bacterium]|nr:MAG: hypothetical protein D6815_06685 [Candidatus Dadabacteria bacterium]